MPQYKANGGLFSNQHKTKDAHPDMRGYLELDDELIDWIIEKRDEGDFKGDYLSIEVSGWKKKNRDNKTWFSISASKRQDRDSDDRGGRSNERSRGSVRRDDDRGSKGRSSKPNLDDDVVDDDEIPF